jgi:hypothetical protein
MMSPCKALHAADALALITLLILIGTSWCGLWVWALLHTRAGNAHSQIADAKARKTARRARAHRDGQRTGAGACVAPEGGGPPRPPRKACGGMTRRVEASDAVCGALEEACEEAHADRLRIRGSAPAAPADDRAWSDDEALPFGPLRRLEFTHASLAGPHSKSWSRMSTNQRETPPTPTKRAHRAEHLSRHGARAAEVWLSI